MISRLQSGSWPKFLASIFIMSRFLGFNLDHDIISWRQPLSCHDIYRLQFWPWCIVFSSIFMITKVKLGSCHGSFASIQGWEFAHSLIAHWLIFLKSNERLWASRSDRSRQMSDRERIAQVAQRKWATTSESLRSLKTTERPWAICSGRSEEMSERAIRSKNVG